MTLEQFAATYRLRLKPVENGEDVIIGKGESQIYYWGTNDGKTLFGALVMHRRGGWPAWSRTFRAAGINVAQNGDWEGCGLFDPENAEQSKLAIKAVEARRRRVLSDDHRKKLAASNAPHRFKSARLSANAQKPNRGA